jgi:hypothetical protein
MSINLKISILILISLVPCYILAQNSVEQNMPQMTIKKTQGKITVDGIFDEPDWQRADMTSPFYQSVPYDTSLSETKTEARLLFDDNNIYVSAKCYQKKDKYVVLSLKRDFGPGTTDLFGLILDPYTDKQNAFSFTVSPYGVQREGLISNGNDYSTDWDNKWTSVVQNYDDYWTLEIAIPFKTIRYKTVEGQNVWYMNMLRYDQSRPVAERSNWARLPRFANGNNIAFVGKLIWETPPPPAGVNVSVIPYVLGSTTKDFIAKKPANTEGGIGLDAKVALSSALNLDMTINPDFAQVEVDQQVTNLSRFELFFPERRQFFLENADLFSGFGFGNINPLFTRRMGLATDNAGNTVKVPILAGTRLTGKLNKNWRVGLMDIQTGVEKNLKLAASNFMATAIQRKVFSRSLLSFIFVNKHNFLSDSEGRNTWELNKTGYNRVAGLDYNLASNDGKWQGKFFHHRSITPIKQTDPFASGASLKYNSLFFNMEVGGETVGKGYKAETGYVPRNNYYRFEPNFSFAFYPKSTVINRFSVGMDADIWYRRGDNKNTDWDFSPLQVNILFQNNARLSVSPLRWDYTYLSDNFDPTNTSGKPLLAGTSYRYRNTRFTYQSNARRHFYVNMQGRIGNYFNGKIRSIQTVGSYRLQPYGVISLDVNYNRIDLPEGYNDRTLWLIGPKFDFSFTKDLFFTTFIQYNNQRNNVNINSRFQWRFAPVSDLFLVYTDNYFAVDDIVNRYSAFEVKNRGLVLKCTYWLNL